MKTLEVHAVHHPTADAKGIQLFMARADLLHPLASGNKFYKLSPNISFATEQGLTQLLSFGGAFSNHIHALALTAQANGFKSVGIIRGEKEYASNSTLKEASIAGMQLEFVTRDEYKRRHNLDYLDELKSRYPDALIIPEGGSSQLAVKGCMQLMAEINAVKQTNIITAACGTGATFAGIVCGLNKDQRAVGYSALKDKSLSSRIDEFISNEGCLNHVYTVEQADYGGFAKLPKEVLDFSLEWLDYTGVLLDPIYTSKMCKRLIEQIKDDEFEVGASITIIHSGGLQGWRGMKGKVLKLAGNDAWLKINTALN